MRIGESVDVAARREPRPPTQMANVAARRQPRPPYSMPASAVKLRERRCLCLRISFKTLGTPVVCADLVLPKMGSCHDTLPVPLLRKVTFAIEVHFR
jgi:hypothetical protein